MNNIVAVTKARHARSNGRNEACKPALMPATTSSGTSTSICGVKRPVFEMRNPLAALTSMMPISSGMSRKPELTTKRPMTPCEKIGT